MFYRKARGRFSNHPPLTPTPTPDFAPGRSTINANFTPTHHTTHLDGEHVVPLDARLRHHQHKQVPETEPVLIRSAGHESALHGLGRFAPESSLAVAGVSYGCCFLFARRAGVE